MQIFGYLVFGLTYSAVYPNLKTEKKAKFQKIKFQTIEFPKDRVPEDRVPNEIISNANGRYIPT